MRGKVISVVSFYKMMNHPLFIMLVSKNVGSGRRFDKFFHVRIQANLDMVFDPSKPTLLDMAKLGAKPRFNTLEELHNMPQKHMGEYEPYQAARIRHYGQPLRKIEEEKDRSQAFGNPYKLKYGGAGIDEVMDSAVIDSNSQQRRTGGDQRQFGMGGPPKRRRGPLGIDAFDQFRTRRSMRGSSIATSESPFSDVDDLSSELGDGEGTSSGRSGASTPVSEFGDLQLQEMDSDEQLHRNLEEVMGGGGRRGQGGEGAGDQQMDTDDVIVEKVVVKQTPQSGEILSKQEIMTRKIRIGSIVRQPANQGAFDEIMKLVTGITKETTGILIRHALRESQRFKSKLLTEKLQFQLSAG
uniref:TAFII55_N domain-containing protein n=1 Tax=Caenorhabditis tropicalis TaxID=1561998 RepID=A0A1I7TVI4_9PELO